jgi:hypothetical protein
MVAVQAPVEGVLSEAEFMDSGIVLAGIVEVVSAFPYLHKKHRELAPQQAIILKVMKKDGTYDDWSGKQNQLHHSQISNRERRIVSSFGIWANYYA